MLEGRARDAEPVGFSTLWLGQTFDYDALGLAGLLGRATQRISLGTWLVPSPTRHPMALGQAALTAQAACGGRLRLGIGVSHRAVLGNRFGIDFPSPVKHMRATLEVLDPLLCGRRVDRKGPVWTAQGGLQIPAAVRPELLLAALQPGMLALAGQASDGAALWLASLKHLQEAAVPIVSEAAARAGRCAQLPSYRAVLRLGGASGPEDVALIGNESELADRLGLLAEAGVDELNALVVPEAGVGGSVPRTTEFLSERALATD
ncbi:MAG: LLM class flavin-dependent oxidoreductase [Deltaproteobacteria bacterium]|nr:LLM class flavin-dependent oxidoreductase [Deltaproteobacteria bacterium]MBW2394546.1 LLM class flavin-dependent oxidoreductase [Deltaproteobacteria bacterium]